MLTVLVTMKNCPFGIRSLRSGESALTHMEMACFLPVIGIRPVKTTISALRSAVGVKVMEVAQVISVIRRALTFLGMAVIIVTISRRQLQPCLVWSGGGKSASPPPSTEEIVILPAISGVPFFLRV